MYSLLKEKVLFVIWVCCFGCAGSPKSMEKEKGIGTKEEARALFSQAMDYVREHGREEAFAVFNDRKGRFVRGDLYVFCLDFDKNWKVMGANPSLVGKNASQIERFEGQGFCVRVYRDCPKEGEGAFNV